MLYFDHAASQSPPLEVVDYYRNQLFEHFANPSSSHRLGKELMQRLEMIRQDILKWVKADKSDLVIFTSSATESNNLVIKGLRKKIETAFITKTDHPSVVKPVESKAEKTLYFSHDSNGHISEVEYQRALVESDLVALSLVNNTTGLINQFNNLNSISKKAHLHWDLSQSFGKLDFDFKGMNADSITISGHKFGAPKGIGILVLKHGTEIDPLLIGGGHEGGLRSSSINYPLIAATHFRLKQLMETNNYDLQNTLKQKLHLQQELLKINSNIEFPFAESQTSPFICCLKLPVPSSDIVMRALEEKGVIVSTSAACSSKNKNFSPVFDALRFPEVTHRQMMRISFSHETTLEDLNKMLDVFREVNKMISLFNVTRK